MDADEGRLAEAENEISVEAYGTDNQPLAASSLAHTNLIITIKPDLYASILK